MISGSKTPVAKCIYKFTMTYLYFSQFAWIMNATSAGNYVRYGIYYEIWDMSSTLHWWVTNDDSWTFFLTGQCMSIEYIYEQVLRMHKRNCHTIRRLLWCRNLHKKIAWFLSERFPQNFTRDRSDVRGECGKTDNHLKNRVIRWILNNRLSNGKPREFKFQKKNQVDRVSHLSSLTTS